MQYHYFQNYAIITYYTVATSLLALRWMCDSPRTGCARNITPIYMWREQAITAWSWHVISCCLLPQCEALRTCRSGFPIATIPFMAEVGNLFRTAGRFQPEVFFADRPSLKWMFGTCKFITTRESSWHWFSERSGLALPQ